MVNLKGFVIVVISSAPPRRTLRTTWCCAQFAKKKHLLFDPGPRYWQWSIYNLIYWENYKKIEGDTGQRCERITALAGSCHLHWLTVKSFPCMTASDDLLLVVYIALWDICQTWFQFGACDLKRINTNWQDVCINKSFKRSEVVAISK